MIRTMQSNNKSKLDSKSYDALDYVICLLNSSELYKPQMNIDKIDASDVNKMIHSMLNSGNAGEDVHGCPAHLQTPIRIVQSSNVKVMELLLNINQWSFDIFEFEAVTDGKPLFHLGMALFEAYDIGTNCCVLINILEKTFECDPKVLGNFLAKVESCYQKNPYHSSTHAADVQKIIGLL